MSPSLPGFMQRQALVDETEHLYDVANQADKPVLRALYLQTALINLAIDELVDRLFGGALPPAFVQNE